MPYKKPGINCSRGFTLVEILVVVTIISLLASLISVNIIKHVKEGRRKTTLIQIRNLGVALDSYYFDIGYYPATSDGLDALIKPPASARNWSGPYLKKGKKIPRDPWGGHYVYTCPGGHGDYDLISFGPDQQPGGKNYDADIVSWDE